MANKKQLDDPQFLSTLKEEAVATVSKALEQALQHTKQGFTLEIERRFGAALTKNESSEAPVVTQSDWTGIESLSRLRSLVGGRFQNIKKKWVDAGLPLREHRGDRWKDFKLDEEAWLDLSNWILKQGYETRLTPQSQEYLFELRSIK